MIVLIIENWRGKVGVKGYDQNTDFIIIFTKVDNKRHHHVCVKIEQYFFIKLFCIYPNLE